MSDEKRGSRQPNWGAGVAIGMGLGVSLSVALDNWAFLAIGAGLMTVFAFALGTPEDPEDEPDASSHPPS